MAFRKQVQQADEKPAFPSVREAVEKHGDEWRLLIGGRGIPFTRREHMEQETSDTWDGLHMVDMERGKCDRIRDRDLYEADERPPVHVEHVYPPIPERCWDYAAYRDPEGLVGRGPTPFLAINDLIEQESEQ